MKSAPARGVERWGKKRRGLNDAAVGQKPNGGVLRFEVQAGSRKINVPFGLTGSRMRARGRSMTSLRINVPFGWMSSSRACAWAAQ